MKARFAALSPRTVVMLAAAGVLLYAVLLWMLFISPKRSESSRLDDEVAAAELRLAEAQAAAHLPSGAGVPVSDVFRLAKAMPSSDDQPGLVLELTRLATSTGVKLRSITSQPSAAGAGGATMIQVVVIVGGSYHEITRFLNRTRSLVVVRRGKLHATGRLFAVQSVELAESLTDRFPELDGTITLSAYVYDGPIVPEGESPRDEAPPSGGTAAAGGTD